MVTVTRFGQQVAIEASANGRARANVILWRTDNDDRLVVDSANLMAKRERRALAEQVPEEIREEAEHLLEDAAIELDRARSNKSMSADEETNPGAAIALEEVEPWPEAVDAVSLFHTLRTLIRRYVVMTPDNLHAVTLWVLNSYVYDVFPYVPYLVILSPERRCGKSRLLEILAVLVHRALLATNLTPAVIYRLVDRHRVALLIDEGDTLGLKHNLELRGILNGGYSKAAAYVYRVEGDSHEVRRFYAFAPKVIAAIGTLPDTLLDRAVVVRLRRKTPNETAARMRGTTLAIETENLRRQLLRWAKDTVSVLSATPAVPDAIHDRAADYWTPMLAVAEAISPDCAEDAREIAVRLTSAPADAESLGALLLEDVKSLFDASGNDFVASAQLVEHLVGMEGRPWPEFRKGRPLTANVLANLLARFSVRPRQRRLPSGPVRGYAASDFADPWARYLATTPKEADASATSVQPA